MKDSDLTGEALLQRIEQLSNASVRDQAGGNGWRHLLYAAEREIRELRYEHCELIKENAALLAEMDDDDFEDI